MHVVTAYCSGSFGRSRRQPTTTRFDSVVRAAYRPQAMGDAVIHREGEGERHAAGGSSAVIIKASGDDSAGSFFLSETTIDPGSPGRRLTVMSACTTCSTCWTAC